MATKEKKAEKKKTPVKGVQKKSQKKKEEKKKREVKKDKYDKAIAYLLAQPNFKEAVADAWTYPPPGEKVNPAHCLFQAVSPSGKQERNPQGQQVGCLTQIRNSSFYRPAWTPELTEEIKADKRIPDISSEVTPKSLPVFAEWQRKLDRTIRRKEKSAS